MGADKGMVDAVTTWTDNIDAWASYEVVRVFDDGTPSERIALFSSELMAYDYADYLGTVGIPALVVPEFMAGLNV